MAGGVIDRRGLGGGITQSPRVVGCRRELGVSHANEKGARPCSHIFAAACGGYALN